MQYLNNVNMYVITILCKFCNSYNIIRPHVLWIPASYPWFTRIENLIFDFIVWEVFQFPSISDLNRFSITWLRPISVPNCYNLDIVQEETLRIIEIWFHLHYVLNVTVSLFVKWYCNRWVLKKFIKHTCSSCE